VLEAVKECGAILATGHLAWQDSYELIKRANKLALEKIIITHPIYQKIAMPVDIQKDLAALGAKIEHCYSMYSIDKVPVRSIASQIKSVGAGNCILSSDVGQSFSKSPSEALAEFIPLLYSAGITTEEAAVMLIDNPSSLSSLS
jgi:predicted metal-dependent phosphotriesterase family hydrolase